MTYFLLSQILVFIGVSLIRKNRIIILVAIEILFLLTTLILVFTSLSFDDLLGLVFAIVIITLVSCETGIGLSIIIKNYRRSGVI